MSIAELLATLYTQVLHYDHKRPDWSERDYFILSVGHAALALYAVLAEVGLFDSGELANYKVNGSIFSPHASAQVPGVELSTGSLGQGLGYAAGLALGFKLQKRPNRVFCLIGDGENDEGSIWEAAQFAGRKHLNNLCLIINRNYQKTGPVIKDLTDYSAIYQGFGFEVKILDGHNPAAIMTAFNSHPYSSTANSNSPLCIIAETIKGKGVSWIEGAADNHKRPLSNEEYQLARKEILENSSPNDPTSINPSLKNPLPNQHSEISMRTNFFNKIYQATRNRNDFILLNSNNKWDNLTKFELAGDLVDVGIAETTMIGLATGLSDADFQVLAYSVGHFSTLRTAEFLRNLPNAKLSNLKIIVGGIGFGNTPAEGATHFATEDLGTLCSLRRLEIFSPADIFEAEVIAELILKSNQFQIVRISPVAPQPIHVNPSPTANWSTSTQRTATNFSSSNSTVGKQH